MRALEGIKILELAHSLAGPYTSMLLADMGADVIKVERPATGDFSRTWGPYMDGMSAYYLFTNRNKKSITLNLKSDEGKKIIFKLVEKSDVFLESFTPGTVERLGMDYEAVKKVNPKIIYCQLSGFGQDGPYRNMKAMDVMMQGMCGWMSIIGEPGSPRYKVGVPICDLYASLYAAYGILSALFYREKTGKGQRLDVSIWDTNVAILTIQAYNYWIYGKIPHPMGTRHPVITPYQAFKTKDGEIILVGSNEPLWRNLCKGLGLERMIDDPRYKTNRDRLEHRDELEKTIQDVVVKKTTDELLDELNKVGAVAGPINTIDKVLNNPHTLYRKMIVEIEHSQLGKMKMLGVPVKYSETPGEIRSPAPSLGEHTREILRDIGYDDTYIENLAKAGVI